MQKLLAASSATQAALRVLDKQLTTDIANLRAGKKTSKAADASMRESQKLDKINGDAVSQRSNSAIAQATGLRSLGID